jgi:hypothetical protein
LTVVDLRTAAKRWRSETFKLGVLTAPAATDGIVVVGSAAFSSTRFWAASGSPEVNGLFAYPLHPR